jgi:hypothetical protein
MRAGIPSQTSRERSITLYQGKLVFQRVLEMPDEGLIYIPLIDRMENVLCTVRGEFNSKKDESLRLAVRPASAQPVEERVFSRRGFTFNQHTPATTLDDLIVLVKHFYI